MTPHHGLPPFHLAIPVHEIAAARAFYGGVLGLIEGRSAATWVDYDFFGHQIVAHLDPRAERRPAHHNQVDSDAVPVPHFGVVLGMTQFAALAERLTAAGVDFVIAPHTRFKGEPGEHATMFLLDYSGNALEFKAFADVRQLFATSAGT